MIYPSSKEAIELLNSQLSVWDLAQSNFKALSGVKVKDLDFGKFAIKVQFNPARIQSSAAKVDAKSIQERKCFLCPQNLPAVQEGIAFGENYQILVNPFPIFPQHFTIPTYKHVDQLIFDRFADMLDLSKALEDFVLFYNGPKCGASAPDHAHFQAGNKGFMPVEDDMKNIEKTALSSTDTLQVYKLENYLRTGFLLEGTDRDQMVAAFQNIYNLLDIPEGEIEPMLNVLSWYGDNKLHCCVFPRKLHRPSCFFAEGDANILISPASVDLGGVFITPLEKDFDKITKEDVQKIFEEISLDEAVMDKIVDKLKNIL